MVPPAVVQGMQAVTENRHEGSVSVSMSMSMSKSMSTCRVQSDSLREKPHARCTWQRRWKGGESGVEWVGV